MLGFREAVEVSLQVAGERELVAWEKNKAVNPNYLQVPFWQNLVLQDTRR